MNEAMNYTKLSNGISWVLHPFLLPVYLMAVLLTMTTFSHYPPNVKFYLLWVVALYAIIIPLLTLGVLRSLGRISDYRIDDRKERFLPLLVGAVCYVLCAITIAKIPSAIFLRKFMIAAACCEVLCLVVSFYWKISLHLTGMGAAVALLVVMNVVGVGNMLVPLMVAILCAGGARIGAPLSGMSQRPAGVGRVLRRLRRVRPRGALSVNIPGKMKNRPETVSGRFFRIGTAC